MKLFNVKEWSMWFHYGNCKQEIEKLKQENSDFMKQLPVLLGQIQEQKGILDYALYEKEKEIEILKNQLDRLTEKETNRTTLYDKVEAAAVEKANKMVRDEWQKEASDLKVVEKKVKGKK